jgi:hypothetical protein
MSDRYERVEESNESTSANVSGAPVGHMSIGAEESGKCKPDALPSSLDAVTETLVNAPPVAKVPIQNVERNTAIGDDAEATPTNQPSSKQESVNVVAVKEVSSPATHASEGDKSTEHAVMQKVKTDSNSGHVPGQQRSQSGKPAAIENECDKGSSGPTTGIATKGMKAGGTAKPPGGRPTSPKGGQRRTSHTSNQQKHIPRSSRPRCRHAGMCRSPRSCYEAFLHATEFGELLNPEDLASWCNVCTKCSICCGYGSAPSSRPVDAVPGIRPDRVSDEFSSPEEVPRVRPDRAPNIFSDCGGDDPAKSIHRR